MAGRARVQALHRERWDGGCQLARQNCLLQSPRLPTHSPKNIRCHYRPNLVCIPLLVSLSPSSWVFGGDSHTHTPLLQTSRIRHFREALKASIHE